MMDFKLSALSSFFNLYSKMLNSQLKFPRLFWKLFFWTFFLSNFEESTQNTLGKSCFVTISEIYGLTTKKIILDLLP